MSIKPNWTKQSHYSSDPRSSDSSLSHGMHIWSQVCYWSMYNALEAMIPFFFLQQALKKHCPPTNNIQGIVMLVHFLPMFLCFRLWDTQRTCSRLLSGKNVWGAAAQCLYRGKHVWARVGILADAMQDKTLHRTTQTSLFFLIMQ